MWRKLIIVLGMVVIAASSANAGTEVVRDYGGAEVNRYAPPPPAPVYYPPPPVVVYPSVAFYPRPFFGFSSRRVVFVRPFPRHVHHWH
jgi:hypothetical protein